MIDKIQLDGTTLMDITTRQWHQCPADVRSYLSNVNYTDVAYTESSVISYVPSTFPASSKPVGLTVNGTTYYNNIPNEVTPIVSGAVQPLDSVRWINSATGNMRDLGGWACDGGTIHYGRIYRCGDINASDETLFISDLGITMEIDLTADGIPAAFDGMEFICAPVYAMYQITNPIPWRTNLRAIFEAVKRGRNVVFHCAAGADRTATLACVIEGLLGVSQSDCDKDYELTSFSSSYYLRARNGSYQDNPAQTWAKLMESLSALSGANFMMKCVNFVASLGFTAAEINEFRAAMIDGTPSTVTPSIATYTVTKSGSHVTFSNSAATADQYQSYECDITPDSGYAINTVSVTMNGTDITASCFEGTQIPIGTQNITANGDIDVEWIKTAHVAVPQGITPSGSLSITANGTYDVTNYASAAVNVSVPTQNSWSTTFTLAARLKTGTVMTLPASVLAHKDDDNFSIEIRAANAWTGQTYRSYFVTAGNRYSGNSSYGLYCYITTDTNNQAIQVLNPVNSTDSTITSPARAKLAIINGDLCFYESAGAGLEANFTYKITASW